MKTGFIPSRSILLIGSAISPIDLTTKSIQKIFPIVGLKIMVLRPLLKPAISGKLGGILGANHGRLAVGLA